MRAFESKIVSLSPEFYGWQGYRCSYECWQPSSATNPGPPLVLIHPIGVGLSRRFWWRFCRQWQQQGHPHALYNLDLLGCGDGDLPRWAYTPADWGSQLCCFLETVVQAPPLVVVQGASLPIALELVRQEPQTSIRGLVLVGPPARSVIRDRAPLWRQRLLWLLLSSPLGWAFFQYARRPQFLRSFSQQRLFARAEAVDREWLELLAVGARDSRSRYAVLSFLAGFWRQNYAALLPAVAQPTLVLVGDAATSISRRAAPETPQQRLEAYRQQLPNAQGQTIAGRNVLPYEATAAVEAVIAPFARSLAR
ncbi:MAG: alpha/beta hydrolase [Cyanobacteria bacterium QS_8_64_29]|nr:MAG: alpha/beta hydrolase [Cyanobacteria bacterium QS_8_64_29]